MGAHGESVPVSVRGVHFEFYEARGAEGRKWLCAVVELLGGAGEGRFTSNVVVNYSMATEVTTAGVMGKLNYYRARAKIPAVEQDARVYVRFFLPPEIVKRDGLGRVPAASLVELEAGGRALEFRAANATGLIDSAERLAAYKEQLFVEAPANDGLLLPLNQTPFYTTENNELLESSPTYLPY